AGVYVSSGKLRGAESRSTIGIDSVGVVLAAGGVLLIGIGMDKLWDWGPWRARPTAPLGLLGLSPAPFVLGAGIALLGAFALWSERCRASGRTPLIAPELVRGAPERSALVSIFAIGAISAGLTFLMPLYIEVVQGRTSLYTALALVPLTVASFSAAVFVMRLTARLSARRIAQYALLLVAAGVALLG